MKSVFLSLCLFSLSLSSCRSGLLEWKTCALLWERSRGTPSGLQTTPVLEWWPVTSERASSDRQPPPISLHVYTTPQGLSWDLHTHKRTFIQISALYKQTLRASSSHNRKLLCGNIIVHSSVLTGLAVLVKCYRATATVLMSRLGEKCQSNLYFFPGN